MIAINIRGTSGSGKSTLARRILAHYSSNVPTMVEGRGRPIGVVYLGQGTPLYVLGHYEAEQGGGADTVSWKEGFPLLEEAAKRGLVNVMWEGVLFSEEVARTIELARYINIHVMLLTTPIDQCLADIRARREARGNVKPLSESNTVGRVKTIERACTRLHLSQSPGLKIHKLDRDAAYTKCAELLGLPCTRSP